MSQLDEELYIALKSGDAKLSAETRYRIAGEGEALVIANRDFSDCNFKALPGQFILFKHCSFRGASFEGLDFFPVSFIDCDMHSVNLKNLWGMMRAVRCDLRGAEFQAANFNPKEHTSDPSAFEDCQLDPEFRTYLVRQGCPFVINERIARSELREGGYV